MKELVGPISAQIRTRDQIFKGKEVALSCPRRKCFFLPLIGLSYILLFFRLVLLCGSGFAMCDLVKQIQYMFYRYQTAVKINSNSYLSVLCPSKHLKHPGKKIDFICNFFHMNSHSFKITSYLSVYLLCVCLHRSHLCSWITLLKNQASRNQVTWVGNSLVVATRTSARAICCAFLGGSATHSQLCYHCHHLR